MTELDGLADTSNTESRRRRLSRRQIATRGLAAGLAGSAAGMLAASSVAAQSQPTPETEENEGGAGQADRVAVEPGQVLSSAIVANGFVFTSGALGIDPATGELAGSDIRSQTIQVLRNLAATLNNAGSSIERVVKTTCYLASLSDFGAFNEIYVQAFPHEPPARSTIQAGGLALGALIEIDCVALA